MSVPPPSRPVAPAVPPLTGPSADAFRPVTEASEAGNRWTRRRVVFTAAAAVTTALAAASLVAAPAGAVGDAQAQTAMSLATQTSSTRSATSYNTAHDAIGGVSSVVPAPGGLTATGWAGDPDADGGNTNVSAVLDGTKTLGSTTTSLPLPAVTKAHDLGPTPGFTLTVPVPQGQHTVCFVARNVGAGMEKVLKCVATPLGTKLTSSQLAAHSPRGAIQHAGATTNAVQFSGWTSDPDDLARRSVVVFYLDGTSAATVTTTPYVGTPPAGAGRKSAFSISVPATTGAHMGCVWVVNSGFGSNGFLGCQAVDTRAGQAMTNKAPATIAPMVVTQAKKHIGQRYVWGAVGPKTFDCSGLVMYSYHKYGYTTPRIAADQFAAARVIPAAKAQPGDLVFYHDTLGHVYHVGIYLSPGLTVAAIDTQEGVNYQRIWDPSTASYGSFTHS